MPSNNDNHIPLSALRAEAEAQADRAVSFDPINGPAPLEIPTIASGGKATSLPAGGLQAIACSPSCRMQEHELPPGFTNPIPDVGEVLAPDKDPIKDETILPRPTLAR